MNDEKLGFIFRELSLRGFNLTYEEINAVATLSDQWEKDKKNKNITLELDWDGITENLKKVNTEINDTCRTTDKDWLFDYKGKSIIEKIKWTGLNTSDISGLPCVKETHHSMFNPGTLEVTFKDGIKRMVNLNDELHYIGKYLLRIERQYDKVVDLK